MPRIKNRGYQLFDPSYTAPVSTRRWRMSAYIRLSKEDLQKIKKGLDCSNSVANQRGMLYDFYESHMEEFESYTEYVDDGFAGTNFERPNFKRMIANVEAGKVKRVIVKDLSRFGRDYLQVGMFTEVLFAQYDIHFIAIANNVDSQKGENDLTPFVN